MKYHITCQQRGRSETNTVTDPVFAVRNGDNGQINILSDNSKYDFVSGNLVIRSGVPHQKFYLIIDKITMEDNDKQFVCLNEDDVGDVEEEFSYFNTTIVVHSDEGNGMKHIDKLRSNSVTGLMLNCTSN